MASLKEVEKVADDLEQLVGEMRSELTNGTDFEKLTQIADEISEKADNAAQTFSTVNETLMSRISDLAGKARSGSRSSSGSKSRSSS
jgi:uncharacterized protein YoxC